MKMQLTHKGLLRTVVAACAALAVSGAALAAGPDAELAPYLGQEITVERSAFEDHLPLGGKLTLVYDQENDLVRLCTRSVPSLRATWREDFALPCNVALNFVRAERYCTEAEVKTGDAETLAGCHRLRSRDVAMHPAAVKGAVELHEVILFPLQRTAANPGIQLAVLLDSPARTTHAGHGIIGNH